ncbi:hypothetical protein SAMN04489727_2223 [Amycolatopsis tolypomycina]|uniref:Uncharacterized protein n=1 Tax=Amycolatopsis tolypomycina TaxID=208445 RepID=A0A1H4P0B6_9PSEU|nr:hypothetical protein [Amycolatopsis tolypomycina]SEC00917.1 hypothetical protein SAMN04489727_2223 [Amycolatopsis tolypomycina]
MEDEPMSAEESLNLIARQHRRTRRELGGGPARMLAAWALAWLVGWGFTYVSVQPGVAIPGWVAGGIVVPLLFCGAIAYTAYTSIRAGRGIRGPSRTVGAMYGYSWALSSIGLMVVDIRITQFQALSSDQVSLLWSGSWLLLTGVLYLAGGMVWQDKLMYGLGAWMIVSAALSVLVGYPLNFLVLTVCGGGGFLLGAIVYFVREKTGR